MHSSHSINSVNSENSVISRKSFRNEEDNNKNNNTLNNNDSINVQDSQFGGQTDKMFVKKDSGDINNSQDIMLCKICYDGESDDKTLVNPCRCQGSMKYIHLECLKKWLGDKDVTHTPPVCEICKHIYKVNLMHDYLFSEKKFCVIFKNFILVFSVVTVILTLITVLIMVILGSTGTFDEETRNKVQTICIGISAGILLIIILVYFKDFKENCYEKNVIDWTIDEYQKSKLLIYYTIIFIYLIS